MTSQTPPSRAGSLPLIGGVLALDFCNTSSGRGTPDHQDHLRTTDNVVTWARHAGVLDAPRESQLRHRCAADVRMAMRLLERALRLRDAIYEVDAALVEGRSPDQSAIDIVGATHADCLADGRLTTRDGGFGWTWDIEQAPEAAILGPIAASAMAIITAADRARLKQCQGHHCGWLFLDTTKSNNRRWCEMEVCGNRAKQRRRRGRQAGG